MILATDVQYGDTHACAACVLFDTWRSAAPLARHTSILSPIAAYEPGKFYKRELPCLLKLLSDHRLQPSLIIVDGHVFLDGWSKPGLGKYLHEALGEGIAVIGVAKSAFKGIDPSCEILRGRSQQPLYVTSIGIPHEDAKAHISEMHGDFRIPALLKEVDALARSGLAQHSTKL